MADSRISVRLDSDTRRRLGEEATETGKSESELVREALALYFRQAPENCLTLASRHDLIGSAKQLPSDLSTNREHLGGFGW